MQRLIDPDLLLVVLHRESGVLQGLLGVQPVDGVFNQEFGDKILSFLRHPLSRVLLKLELPLLNILQNLFLIFSVEWRRPAQDDEGDDPDGPDVALFIVLIIQDLRCDVVWLGELVKGGEIVLFQPVFSFSSSSRTSLKFPSRSPLWKDHHPCLRA